MPDLGLLDSLIAMVVVLLVLSLIVQSIQSALKKLLKIKSRQIEDSLLDLFENALGTPSAGTQGMLASSPVLRILSLRRKHPAAHAQTQVRELYQAVWNKFGEVGRVAQSGRVIFDSISKEDLLKVMARVAPETLLPGFVQKLEDACGQVLALEKALAAIGSSGLSGESATRLASLRQAVAPMVNDVNAVFKSGKLDPSVLIGDVVRLREVRLDDLLALLAELQKGVDKEIAEAKRAGQPTTALDIASQGLTQVADQLAGLASQFDKALAPLRTRLRSVETWYDTVMQSFEERYSRGMRTWAFVLSLLVVVVSDANFFTVWNRVLNGDVARILEVGGDLTAADPGQPADAAAGSPAPTTAGETQTAQEIVDEARSDVSSRLDLYTDMGFQPLTLTALGKHFSGLGPATQTLSGWLLMALLLSVGAPFWQDTLESLFGIKNLLRKRGSIQNVEQKSGEGNPKQG